MANAQIVFTQGSSSAGSGYAMLGVTGTSVIVSNGDDSDVVGWMFEVLDVGLGSAVEQGIVQEGETPTWTFDPDATGCYVLRLTTQDRQGNLYEDVRVFGVLESNGLLIPSFMADAAACNFVIGGVTNEKGWSPFVNAWLKIVEENGGGSAPWTQDCSTGGTIAYSGPMPPPALVILTGTPSGPFWLEMPDGPWVATVVNQSPQSATITNSNSNGWIAVSGRAVTLAREYGGATLATTIRPGDGNILELAVPNGFMGDAQIAPFENGPGLSLLSVGAVNVDSPGSLPLMPVYGTVLNPIDVASYEIVPPVAGAGPIATLEGAALWQTTRPPYGFRGLSWGWQGADQSGAANVLVEPAVYPNVAWTSQPQTTLGGKFGDEIVGPSGSTVFDFVLPLGLTHATIKIQACVMSTAGSSEAVGDVYSSVSDMAWTSTGTAVAIVSPVLVPSTVFASASMAAMSVSCGAAGINAQVVVGAPATLDPSTVVDVQVRVYNADVGPWMPPTL